MYSPSTINDPTIDVSTKVNLANIVVLQNSFIPRVGSIVSSTMVDRAPWGKEGEVRGWGVGDILAEVLGMFVIKVNR